MAFSHIYVIHQPLLLAEGDAKCQVWWVPSLEPKWQKEPTLVPCPYWFLSAHRDISFSFVLLLSCVVNSKYWLQLWLSAISYIGALSSCYSICGAIYFDHYLLGIFFCLVFFDYSLCKNMILIGHYTSRLEKTLSGMYSEIVTSSYSHFWLSLSTFYSALPFASFLLLSSVKLLAILQFLRLKKDVRKKIRF